MLTCFNLTPFLRTRIRRGMRVPPMIRNPPQKQPLSPTRPVANCAEPAQLPPMLITLDSIVEETRQWPDDVVAELIDRIVVAKHGGIEAQHAEAWAKVAQARLAEAERDPLVLVDGDVVSARIRKIVGL